MIYLKKKLSRIVEDNDVLNFLNILIDSFNKETNKGLPMGNQSSQLFALLYLNDVDHFIKEKLHMKYYVRYMDDMFLLTKCKDEARLIFNLLKVKIEEENLKINPKSQIISFSRGSEFIGYRIHLLKEGKVILKIRNTTKRRVLKNIRKRKTLTLKERESSLMSYLGLFKYASAFYFKERIKTFLLSKKII